MFAFNQRLHRALCFFLALKISKMCDQESRLVYPIPLHGEKMLHEQTLLSLWRLEEKKYVPLGLLNVVSRCTNFMHEQQSIEIGQSGR